MDIHGPSRTLVISHLFQTVVIPTAYSRLLEKCGRSRTEAPRTEEDLVAAGDILVLGEVFMPLFQWALDTVIAVLRPRLDHVLYLITIRKARLAARQLAAIYPDKLRNLFASKHACRPHRAEHLAVACYTHFDKEIFGILADATGLSKDHVLYGDGLIHMCRLGNRTDAEWLVDKFGLDVIDARHVAFSPDVESHWSRLGWKNSPFTTPFIETCRFGHLDIAMWLADRFQFTDNDAHNYDDQALVTSCEAGHAEVVTWLTTRFTFGPEHAHAQNDKALRAGLLNGHFEAVAALYSGCNLQPDDLRGQDNWILQTCCANGDVAALTWLVREGNLDVHDVFQDGRPSPFTSACAQGHVATVARMVELFGPEAVPRKCRTSMLFWAVQRDLADLVTLVERAGWFSGTRNFPGRHRTITAIRKTLGDLLRFPVLIRPGSPAVLSRVFERYLTRADDDPTRIPFAEVFPLSEHSRVLRRAWAVPVLGLTVLLVEWMGTGAIAPLDCTRFVISTVAVGDPDKLRWLLEHTPSDGRAHKGIRRRKVRPDLLRVACRMSQAVRLVDLLCVACGPVDPRYVAHGPCGRACRTGNAALFLRLVELYGLCAEVIRDEGVRLLRKAAAGDSLATFEWLLNNYDLVPLSMPLDEFAAAVFCPACSFMVALANHVMARKMAMQM